MGQERDPLVHERCGRPWAEHAEVDLGGGFLVPVCDDEFRGGRALPPRPADRGDEPRDE